MKDKNLLNQLVTIPSVFPEEYSIAEFIDKWVKKNVICKSFSQDVSPKRKNIFYSKGSGKKVVLLVGHMDTVPVADGWGTNPFKPVEKKGNLYGLGAWDMKAGVYLILQCLKNIQPKNITLKVAFTVDEENYSVGAHKLVDSGFCKDVSLILIPEPGFRYGEHGITVGRTGRVTYVVKILGKSSHGNTPEEGVNAISQTCDFLREVSKIKFKKDIDTGITTVFPRAFATSVKGFSVPDEAEIELDCKLIAPDTPESVFEKINSVAKKMFKEKKLLNLPAVTYKERPTPFCSPYKIKKDNQYVKLCEKIARKAFGRIKFVYNDSVADECIFVRRLKIPAICVGPDGANAHSADEYVKLASLEKVEKFYLDFLSEIDK